MGIHKLTINEASKLLAKGEIVSVDLTKAVFERIENIEPEIHAYLTFCKEEALREAAESDKRRQRGEALSLIDGVPIGIKDLFVTKDIKTTAASKILNDYMPEYGEYESTAVKKLKDAGAIIVGKTNLDEFAMGSSNENSAYGTTKNPWALDRVPGGSSGGSAAAVAADECLAALGTDTGGSIRQPASFCGITGLKVTYGLVSRYGVVAYASSFDTIGPMAKSVDDIALLLNIIAGNDPKDSTTIQAELPDYTQFLGQNIEGKIIGIPKEFYGDGLDPEVAKIMEGAKDKFRELGAKIVEVSLPMTKYAISAYYILVKSEASSNLSRYDGIRYGYSTIQKSNFKSQNLGDIYFNSREEGFGAEPKRSIMMGTYTLSAGYYDAYYKKASKIRTLIKKEYEEVFKNCDILLAPVSPFPAFKIGEKSDDPLQMYMADVNTVPVNVSGVPAMSVPAGFDSKGLPIGMQLIGPMFGEDKLIAFGSAWQKVTKYHLQKPL